MIFKISPIPYLKKRGITNGYKFTLCKGDQWGFKNVNIAEGKEFKMKKIFIFTIFMIFAMGFTLLHAHKVNIFYYAENNIMYLETYFSDGTKCRNSEIEVYDNKLNKLLLKGKTDLKGRFQFKIPKLPAGDPLKIVLNAEMGHRAEVIVKPSEWTESEDSRGDNKNNGNNENISESSQVSNGNVKVECDYKKIEKILDKKLKPVLREIALLRDNKPSFNEIFGGIGYIFGLFGIILYFKSRK
jgi:nickel transport protein